MRFRDFDDAWEYLRTVTNYEYTVAGPGVSRVWKLRRIRRALRELGDPQRAVRWIHVAGSKGKGSVCLLTEAALRASGRRTGLYTSPHLTDVRERIAIDGAPIDGARFARHLGPIVEISEAWQRRGEPRLTFFESLTALAILAFAREGVQDALLETGLGGRLDATNAVRPALTVIARIEREHERILGDTLAAIAREKAGILKRGVPVLAAPWEPEALAVVRAVARQRGCPVHVLGEDLRWEEGAAADPGRARTLRTPWGDVPDVRLSVLGEHQWDNAALAGAAALALGVPPAAVRAGLASCALPGRCERLGERLIVDGAHTVRSAEALRAVIEALGWDAVALVYASHEDKRYPEILARLAPRVARVWTVGLGGPRGVPAGVLARAARSAGIRRARSARGAAQALRDASATGLPVVVTGSVYLAGAARAFALRASQRSSAESTESGTSLQGPVR